MTLEELGRRIGQLQIRAPAIFLIAALLITLITLPGLPLLIQHVEPSLEKILPQEVQVVKTMNAMRSQYGADMMYLVIEPNSATVEDLRHPAVLKYEDAIAQKLLERDHILEVQTLADIVKQTNNGIIPNDLEEVKRLLSQSPQTAVFLDNTKRVGVIHIRSDTGASAAIIKETVTAINEDLNTLEEFNPGVGIQLTGFNTIDKATFEIIISDFARITLFSFLFMLLFLILYYKGAITKVWQSLSIIIIALIWTLGLTGYLNITITVVSMVAAAMIMALGISYGIHIVHRFSELQKTHNRRETLISLQEELLRALLGSSMTTSAGFLALLFGILPAMKNLGIILAMGIGITLLVSVFVVPVILYTTTSEKRTKRNTRTNNHKNIGG
ncbi:MMPL family transporter [Candidatus Woesearchaeota archaeon]|nr:MMPL family transporter [Candidatus Woesearchaeota archaeon]